ncbi:MAG: hypothetical protein ACRDVZ_15995 [Jiangellaceae bacterium]
MTLYAYDETRGVLITTWDTGTGRVAHTLGDAYLSGRQSDLLTLAESLSNLSRLLWRTYTHPASAADSLEPNSEGWRRQSERDAFADVLEALRSPNLPHDGYIDQSYILVEEAAHRVGRALHALQEPALAAHIQTDVAAELAAVEQAERGDLSGRARQAVALSRADVSPVQVSAANELFKENPYGSPRLFEVVDPAAAAVAAAHWLQAAAEVAAEVADCNPTAVVHEADNIEALAVETPTLVLERAHGGETPRVIVTDLIRAAMTVAEGRLPDPDLLVEQIKEARRQAERFGPGDRELPTGLMPRATPLDPARPAHDLLEDLLDGIRGCRLLYHEYADSNVDVFADADDPDEDFVQAVRAEASANQDRLL